MITGPIDYKLHVIFLATTMSFFSYCLIVATILSLSYRLGYISALALSGIEVLYIACKAKQLALLVSS